MDAWDNPAAFGLTAPPPPAPAVAAQPQTSAWDNPTAFGLTPAAPAVAAPKVQPDGFLSRADNVVRTIFNDATFGAGKNIDAAEAAAEQPLFHAGNDGATFGDRYAANLVDEKARLASVPLAVRAPLGLVGGAAAVSGLGEVAAAAGAAARLIPGANALMDAGGAVAQPIANALGSALPAAKVAAGGAAFGTAQGFGDTDGGLQNRLYGAGVGALIGGVAAPLVEGGINLAGKVVTAAGNALSSAGYGAKTAIVDAAGNPILGAANQPVMATRGVTQDAGNKLVASAADPAAAQAALAKPTVIVPGSQPTTFQATGDRGLGEAELALRNTPGGAAQAFLAQADKQNAARVGAIQSAAPVDSSSADLANALVNRQGQIATQAANETAANEQGLQRQIGQADQAVRGQQLAAGAATEAMGGAAPATGDATNAQVFGKRFRDALQNNSDTSKDALGKVWDAVDPDGSLVVNSQPLQQSAMQVLAEHGQFATPLGGDEQRIIDLAANQSGGMKFSDLKDFRSQVTDAVAQAKEAGDRQTVRRLTQLLSGVDDTLGAGVSDAVQAPGGDGIVQRLAPHIPPAPEGADAAPAGSGGGGVGVAADAGGGSPSVAGQNGVPIPQGQRFASSAGNNAVAPKAATLKPSAANGRNFTGLLIRNGGIREESGELASMGITNRTHPTLVRASGMSHDAARELAIENGYLPPDSPNQPNISSVSDVRNMLAEEASGRKQYTPEDQAQMQVSSNYDKGMDSWAAQTDRARGAVLDTLDDIGGESNHLPPEWVESAARNVALGHGVHEAIADAQTGWDAELRGQADGARYFGTGPGVDPTATQSNLGVGGGSRLRPNFDAGALDRYDAARAATVAHHSTYTNAPGVGNILAQAGRGGYKVADSDVGAQIFSAGRGSAERVKAALAAGVSPQQISDYAAYSLRKVAQRTDGSIDPAAAARWRQNNAEGFQALTQAEPSLRGRFDTAQQMGQRLDDLTAQRKALDKVKPAPGASVQQLKDYESSVARHFLGNADPADRIGSILTSATRVSDASDLARLTANDPAARAGLQRATVDHIFNKLQSNASAGKTGTEKLKSDQFQTFIDRAAPAMTQYMTPAQVKSLADVAADLQRANRSVDGLKSAGGSDTTQKAALMAASKGTTLLGALRANALTGGLTLLGYLKGGPIGGFLANRGASLIENMKSAGLEQTSDLFKEAMLNPGLARVLMSNVTQTTAPHVASALASQIGRIAAARTASLTEPGPTRH